MKPKLILLNLLLVACLGAIAWQTRVQWLAATAVRQANLNVTVKPVPPPPLTPAARPESPVAVKYADVANKNLFSKDRNANIIVDPPKVEIPKPMPPLPVVFGVMGLPSGVKAIMAEKPGAPSTTVRAGETLGEFKIVALDSKEVTFEWTGKQITKKIDDLIDRSGSQTASSGGNQPAGGQPANLGAPPPPPPQPAQAVNNHPTSADLGEEMTATMRNCKPGDTSPYGSLVDGYKKTSVPFAFGPLCRWIR